MQRDEDDQPANPPPAPPGTADAAVRNILIDAPGVPAQSGVANTRPDGGRSHLIGDALKSVYQRTLEEDIPDDFLDLLKQLK